MGFRSSGDYTACEFPPLPRHDPKEILLLGLDDLSAEEALRLGMINRVVPAGQELAVAQQLARQMAVIDPGVVRQTKAAINRSMQIAGMDDALEAALAADVALEGAGSDDKRTFLRLLREGGMKAALDWRRSRFAD